jgi:hypothetical protein
VTVFKPEKQIFNDVTIEVKVLTDSTKTAAQGDFRYGVAFRRTSDQYYAFTISPRTKKWFVLKNSPAKLRALLEGTDNNIHDLDTDDTLRVDIQGSKFIFYINDEIVGQATDSDYANGEVGFYVEAFDAPNAHIHFDSLTVRNFEASQPGITTTSTAVSTPTSATTPTQMRTSAGSPTTTPTRTPIRTRTSTPVPSISLVSATYIGAGEGCFADITVQVNGSAVTGNFHVWNAFYDPEGDKYATTTLIVGTNTYRVILGGTGNPTYYLHQVWFEYNGIQSNRLTNLICPNLTPSP